MAGLGAAFALFLTNIDSVAKYVGPYSIRWALLWFSASLLLGLIAKWLSVSVVAGLSSTEKVGEQLKAIKESGVEINFLAVLHFYFASLLLPYKCVALRTLGAARSGDQLIGVRFIVKLSQWQALLTLVQIVCATISVLILALGIKF